MIKLVLHIEFTDKEHADEILYMDAPELPAGVNWHEGMLLVLDDDQYAAPYEVSGVWVNRDGRVEVNFFVEQSIPFSDAAIADFMEDGWRSDSNYKSM